MSAYLEICCTSFQSAKNAQEADADRIELCDNLFEGGTTPSLGLIKKIESELSIPNHVLIRPRGGDFVYTEHEFDVMLRDIELVKQLDVEGIVTGVLKADSKIDIERTEFLIAAAGSMNFTFHRAFDLVVDQQKSLHELIELGVDRILTSGGMNSVAAGAKTIAELLRAGGESIQIMAGGGLTTADIAHLRSFGCQHFHTTAKRINTSKNSRSTVLMNSYGIPENSVLGADLDQIKEYRELLDLH